MNIKPLRAIILLFTALSVISIYSCSSDSSSTTTSNSYTATQSPGDVWSWTLTSSTFEATNDTTGFTYSGTSETLENLFLKLTVTASTDPDVPTDGTGIAYALEVPGTALIVKPAGTDSKAIVGVGQGTCPTADTTYNWITIPRADWDATNSDAYGTAASTVSGTDLTFQISAFQLDGTSIGTNTASTTCSNGVMTESGSGTATIGIAPSGTFVGDNGPNDGGFIGVVAPSADISTADITAASLEYRGVLFKNNDSSGDDTEPVWARRSSSGVMSGGNYTDFEGNTESSEGVTVTFTSQPSPGVMQATLTDSNGSSDFVFVVNQVDSSYVLYGIAQDAGGGSTQPYNVLLVSQ